MIQIRPQEAFPIVYRIADPSDAATYYVRSVVRNSVTGAIINIANAAFVNLTQDATDTHRFSKTIKAPVDASGLGFYIDVTTKVYTDSGYSTQSSTYLEKNDTYLVQERWNVGQGTGGGFYPKQLIDMMKKESLVDYDLIGKKAVEAFGALPTTDIPETDMSPVLDGHRRLEGAIKAIKPIDFGPYAERIITEIRNAISSINIPTVDFGPLLARIEAIKIPEHKDYGPDFQNLKDELRGRVQEVMDALPDTSYVETLDDLTARIAGFKQSITGVRKPKPDDTPDRAKRLSE